jgi:hypothetical protein
LLLYVLSPLSPLVFPPQRKLISKRRLTALKGFEDLLSSTNGLNRKLEEVLGMTREYETISSLWGSFYQLMRNSDAGEESVLEEGDTVQQA